MGVNLAALSKALTGKAVLRRHTLPICLVVFVHLQE